MASLYARTYQTDPELWDEGGSFLAKVEYEDGQAIFAAGWHYRQIQFEYPSVRFVNCDEPPLAGLPTQDKGAIFLTPTGEAPQGEITAFEFEGSLDGTNNEDIAAALAYFTPAETASEMVAAMSHMNKRVSANRSDNRLRDALGFSIAYLDLLGQNLPARSGNTAEPLRTLKRWCRVYSTTRGTITLYEPLNDEGRKNLRWPHNCIWLNRGAGYFSEPTVVGSLQDAILTPIKYEEYNLENWRVEFEFWENYPFQILTESTGDEATQSLSKAQKEIGILSQFITDAFLSVRNLDRRSKNNALITSHPDIQNAVDEKVTQLTRRIKEDRELLVQASALLANTAQSVQAIVDQDRAETAESMSTFVSFASAIFFVPTLIISFFSMSIIGLAEPSGAPSMLAVLILCIVAAIVMVVFLYLFQAWRKRRRRQARNK